MQCVPALDFASVLPVTHDPLMEYMKNTFTGSFSLHLGTCERFL